jgi:catalase-peroxidase
MAIEDMGGPVLGFCGGRIDHVDNSQTLALGPTPEQEKFAECEVDGDCQAPLGQNTLGLIYVNPEGPMGKPDPQGAADTIRDVFGRMDMDDRENVALIGGGHTFGKTHGASTEGPGPKPFECPANPWPGNFGTGKGNDAVTSGFEGAWTGNPTSWDNTYFKNLVNYEWEPWVGPGGHYQWRVKGDKGPKAPLAQGEGQQDIMMLTTDIGLATDPEYRKYVEEFANDEKAFSDAFAAVWYKLVNRDMGPVTRCVGPDVAPAQPFQFPLPDPPAKLADFDAVAKDVSAIQGGEFVRLALQSANTYRCTDYLGGCNGARIRFSPGKDWETNAGLDKTLKLLEPVKNKYGDGLSWADLIVLAGSVAVKALGAPSDLPFCGGRTDAPDGAGWRPLEYGNAKAVSSVDDMIARYERRGLTAKEFVALSFAKHPSTTDLKKILTSDVAKDGDVIEAAGFKYNPDLRMWVEYYIAAGNDVFARDFAAAWTKLMTADRFNGPTGNVCSI